MNRSFTAEPHDDQTVIIRIGKSLDFRSASAFKLTCQEQIRAGTQRFILDFSETGILDSTGLGAIFSLYRSLEARPDSVVFAAPTRPVETVLQLTRTYRIFRRFPTVEAACEAAPGDRAASSDFPSAA